MKPIVIDLYAGLGGWSDGFIAEGYTCIGFDIERHDYGTGGYPGQLVLQDVLTIHGSQFKNAVCIVASPPCTEYSYMAMPWTRAKQVEKALRGKGEFPEGYTGSRTVAQLNALFDACFRIQREACEAAGRTCRECGGEGRTRGLCRCERCDGSGVEKRHIPLVVENVCGAQKWVGPAKARFGSFFFWGDVESVGGRVVAGGMKFGGTIKPKRRGAKIEGTGSWFYAKDNPDAFCHRSNHHTPPGLTGDGLKLAGNNSPRLWAEREVQRLGDAGRKVEGLDWNEYGKLGYKPKGFNVTAAQQYREEQGGKGFARRFEDTPMARLSSRSDSRKAASAHIAKIPYPLASYIARAFKPLPPPLAQSPTERR